jgi:hypothetical protein
MTIAGYFYYHIYTMPRGILLKDNIQDKLLAVCGDLLEFLADSSRRLGCTGHVLRKGENSMSSSIMRNNPEGRRPAGRLRDGGTRYEEA